MTLIKRKSHALFGKAKNLAGRLASLGSTRPKRAAVPSPATSARANPVVTENALPGSPSWRREKGVRQADDIAMQINAFASATSVNGGESITFYVTADTDERYGIAVYRLGSYGGAGARKVLDGPALAGVRQPDPVTDPVTGMITCDWSASWDLTVPQTWISGTYMAVFTTASGWRCVTPFVVRDDSRQASLCVVMSFTTYLAYNMWPMDGKRGKNFYYGFDENGKQVFEKRALKASFDRPYHRDGYPSRFDFDFDFIRWAEAEGYDLTYVSSVDLHEGRVDPSKFAGLVFPGHDEYWSGPMRDVAEKAVVGGTSLAFLTANNMYWHVRIGASAQGEPARVVTCYKGAPDFDPEPDNYGTTVVFRQDILPAPNNAEQLLLGIQYNGILPKPVPLVVQAADHWFWAGTEVKDGDLIDQMVGGEADGVDSRYPRPEGVNQTLLAASPYRLSNGDDMVQNTSLYETPEGTIVFAAGSLDWPAGLSRPGRADSRIQQATRNVLDTILSRRAVDQLTEAS